MSLTDSIERIDQIHHDGERREEIEQPLIDQEAQAKIWGIKTPDMQLREAKQMKEVTEKTLAIIEANIGEILSRGRTVELERTRTRVKQHIEKLEQQNQQITQHMIEAGYDVDEVATVNYRSELGMDRYQDLMDELAAKLRICGKPDDVQRLGAAKQNTVIEFKTPKLQLRKYSGDPLRWTEFWEQFRYAIHDRPMQASAKMVQLRELLVGRAAAVIRGLPLSDENYDIAIRRLEMEFGDHTQLRSAHIKAIRDIQPIINAANLNKLRRFYEDIATNYAALESMGFETHVLCLVEETVLKLPRTIKYEITKDDRRWTRWGFKEFLEKLWNYLKTCEEIEPCTKSEKSILHATTSSSDNFRNDSRQTGISCVFCNDKSHKSFQCKQVVSREDRVEVLKRERRCFNCTRTGHTVGDCKSRSRCFDCRGKHHSSICNKKETAATEEKPSSIDPGMHIRNGTVAYQTVKANIGGQPCRILLDSGSGGSYISREHGRKLQVQPIRNERRTIGTVNGNMEVTCPIYQLVVESLGKSKEKFITDFAQLDMFMLSSIPNSHPESQKHNYDHLRNLWFSDVSKEENLPIHAIIGVKDFARIRTGKIVRGKPGEPIAEETTLGWTLMGSLGEQQADRTSIVHMVIHKPGSIEEESKQLWDLDVLGVEDGSKHIYEEFADSVTQKEDGRYSVRLPWKKGNYYLPENRQLSETRLRSQYQKLKRTPDILEEYDNIVKMQIADGVVEPVPQKPDGERVSYIPHHPIIRKDAETTKLRIVYDASAKSRKYNHSLNDCLHIGPSLLPLMYDILLRFRLYPVILLGDIQKAFLQIEVDRRDRDSMRFLWFKDIKAEQPVIEELRFTRVIFGSGPSPFLLNGTIREHMKKYQAQDPEFVDMVISSLYVDDFVGGCNTVEDACRLKQKLTETFHEGKFTMRKWKTNNEEFRQHIQSDSKEECDATLKPEQESQTASTKVLGVSWNQFQDVIAVDFTKLLSIRHEPTQRGMLRSVSTIFDPLGLACPVSIIGKVIYHEVCLQKLGWDGEVSADLVKRWDKWIKDVAANPRVQADRLMLGDTAVENASIEIHGFSDSSIAACCAAIYLVVTQGTSKIVKLLTAKARVAKPGLSVPRLELVGAQMLTRMLKNIKAALAGWQITAVYGWTDSRTVLCWLANRGEWKQFVRTRVNQILSEDYISWRYCPTHDNPADIGSRGMISEKLQASNLWWQGPVWLPQQEQWPPSVEITEDQNAQEEKRETSMVATITENNHGLADTIDASRYVSAKKLFRITAFVLRFISNCRKKSITKTQLSSEEIQKAEIKWIEEMQKKHEPTKDQTRQLGLQLNEHGILICKGRFDIPVEEQPIYIPKHCILVPLIIMDAHRRVLHMGVASTLAEVRSRYWVPNGRQMVKKTLKHCWHCKRYKAKAFNAPETAPLPSFRSQPGYPFQSTGVDFAGPVYYKRGKKLKKAYITLFTCATTRAIHLECVEDMTAATFRRSLKNLVTRRGAPQLIISDNAKTFKSTARWLKSVQADDKTQTLLNSLGISWRFNLSKAAWWGGFFERMVALVKNSLKKCLGRSQLTFEELGELMLDIEFSLNNRPLTYQGEDLEMEPLTPNHLIHGRRMKEFPAEEVFSDEEKIPARKRLRNMQRIKKHYWKRWSTEYLRSLREYHKIEGQKDKIAKGDIVLIKNDMQSRNMWKLGKITRTIKGTDGATRGAELQTMTNGRVMIIERPVQLLYPMEINVQEDAITPEEGSAPEDAIHEGPRRKAARQAHDVLKRPRRKAARQAHDVMKTQLMLEDEEENQIFI